MRFLRACFPGGGAAEVFLGLQQTNTYLDKKDGVGKHAQGRRNSFAGGPCNLGSKQHHPHRRWGKVLIPFRPEASPMAPVSPSRHVDASSLSAALCLGIFSLHSAFFFLCFLTPKEQLRQLVPSPLASAGPELPVENSPPPPPPGPCPSHT